MAKRNLTRLLSQFNYPAALAAINDLSEELWEEDKGCLYTPLTNTGLVMRLTGGSFPAQQVEIESLKVTGTLAPHLHERSNTAALVTGVGIDGAPEQWLDDRWHPLSEGQIVEIPAGTPHGFRVNQTTLEPFFLLVVADPPIADGDTVYI